MAEALRPGHQVTSSKLRKSCDSCALTKVGCDKEKPICGRCAKHGQPCVYSTARRAGRTSGGTRSRAKGDSTTVAMTPISQTLTTAPTLDYTATSSAALGASAFSPSLDLSRRQSSPSNLNILAVLSSPSKLSLWSMLTNSCTELDEWSAAAADFLENPLDGDASSASRFNFGLEDFNDYSSSSFTNISSLFPGSSEANVTPTSQTPIFSTGGSVVAHPNPDDAHVSMNIEASQAGQPCHLEPSSQCLARAQGLLARLSLDRPRCWNLSTDSGPSSKLPDFEYVVAQNERTSEGIRTILQCSCSNDSYLLVTLSLVVFKIIAWYTAAACAASGEDPILGASSSAEWQSLQNPLERVSQRPSTNRRDYDSEGEDQQRIAIQLILSKLAGVQVLVDQLSQRLPKICDKTNDTRAMDSPIEIASTPNSLAGRISSTRPLSGELTHTLEADLRKRLVELSQAIIERLRQG